MKRLSSSDSVAGLISLCPSTSTDEQISPRRYGIEFQSMLERFQEEDQEQEQDQDQDEEMIIEEYSGVVVAGRESSCGEKKRRLSNNQVKALEKNFEIENKLEPERKVKLAQELGLQPRQVAVWFQNRRARWKTKQLEKDYASLKTQFDSLQHNFDQLRRDNDSLLQEISKLKSKLTGDEEEEDNNLTPESEISVKKEIISNQNQNSTEPSSPPQLLEHSGGFNYRSITEFLPISTATASTAADATAAAAGSSDSSESSAVLNEIPGGGIFQFVKTENSEDHDDFLSGEEACGFFSDEQPPSLHWYSAVDHWT